MGKNLHVEALEAVAGVAAARELQTRAGSLHHAHQCGSLNDAHPGRPSSPHFVHAPKVHYFTTGKHSRTQFFFSLPRLSFWAKPRSEVFRGMKNGLKTRSGCQEGSENASLDIALPSSI